MYLHTVVLCNGPKDLRNAPEFKPKCRTWKLVNVTWTCFKMFIIIIFNYHCLLVFKVIFRFAQDIFDYYHCRKSILSFNFSITFIVPVGWIQAKNQTMDVRFNLLPTNEPKDDFISIPCTNLIVSPSVICI